MKKLIIFILLYFFLNSTHGQSFLGIHANSLQSNSGRNNLGSKIGFGLRHEKSYFNGKYLKLIWAEILEYKRINTQYETTGLYPHSYTQVTGTLHLLDAQLEGKIRTNTRLFAEMGVFTSFSLVKKLTPSEISRYKSDFNIFNGGYLVGSGYHFSKITVLINTQMGMFSILKNGYKANKTRQMNLCFIKSLSH